MRIIAGEFGGRVLQAPHGRATRPTSDRVREALFSILGDVAGVDVLDLFAGSGALGFEALSRGAESVTFVEEARAALQAVRKNAEALDVAARIRLVAAEASVAIGRLAREERRFSLAFLDPPYALSGVATLLSALTASGILLEGAWVVLEHAARTAPPDGVATLPLRFTREYGDTALTFYRHTTTEVP